LPQLVEQTKGGECMLTDNEKFIAHYVSVNFVRCTSNISPKKAAKTLCALRGARARHVTNDEALKISNSADQHLTTILQPETALPRYWEELIQLTEREQFVVEIVAVYAAGAIKEVPNGEFNKKKLETIEKFIKTHDLTTEECNQIVNELLDEFFLANQFLNSLRVDTKYEQFKGRFSSSADDQKWGV
tara:strand:+ start:1179 stop:1742 length:564 start_codon:yes stop_codon:yes gene_type:complete